MNSPHSADLPTADWSGPAQAILAEVTCTWAEADPGVEANSADTGMLSALIMHAATDLLVLEASNSLQPLPPLGTVVRLSGNLDRPLIGRLAEHGRNGRFLVSVGSRPIRSEPRVRVSLPAVLRSPTFPVPQPVEIVDLTTLGARVRGIELPIGEQVRLDFTPPALDQPVIVRASVAHGTHHAKHPWIGLAFRLVAMRGGASGAQPPAPPNA